MYLIVSSSREKAVVGQRMEVMEKRHAKSRVERRKSRRNKMGNLKEYQRLTRLNMFLRTTL